MQKYGFIPNAFCHGLKLVAIALTSQRTLSREAIHQTSGQKAFCAIDFYLVVNPLRLVSDLR